MTDVTLDIIKNIYFFNSLPYSALQKILSLCTEQEFLPNEILFYEDSFGDRFFIVLEGELEIWKQYGQVNGVLLGITRTGQPLGEMALIDKQPRSATVKAKTKVRVLVIQASDFDLLLSSENSICISLLRSVTLMVRHSNEAHISDLADQNKKLAKAFLDLQQAQDELMKRERLSVIGSFSSLILHDIRNPLSAIKSRLEILKTTLSDETLTDENWEKITKDIDRMEVLCTEFLDYARGDVRLQMSVCDINKLFIRLTDALEDKFTYLKINYTFSCQITKNVIFDEDRILRMLINACDNACKAMNPEGKLEITASEYNNQLLFKITDSGIGMSKAILDHIFEPFYTQSSSGGIGLGMVIIKSIVDAHKGTIQVQSEKGQGTTLSILLPVL